MRKEARRSCSITLLTRQEADEMEPCSARSLTVRVPDLKDEGRVRVLDIFVLRDPEGTLRLYENHCPHAGGPLNMVRAGVHAMSWYSTS